MNRDIRFCMVGGRAVLPSGPIFATSNSFPRLSEHSLPLEKRDDDRHRRERYRQLYLMSCSTGCESKFVNDLKKS